MVTSITPIGWLNQNERKKVFASVHYSIWVQVFLFQGKNGLKSHPGFNKS